MEKKSSHHASFHTSISFAVSCYLFNSMHQLHMLPFFYHILLRVDGTFMPHSFVVRTFGGSVRETETAAARCCQLHGNSRFVFIQSLRQNAQICMSSNYHLNPHINDMYTHRLFCIWHLVKSPPCPAPSLAFIGVVR